MKARTVCCRKLVDAEKAPKAKNKWGEFLVCNDTCKGFCEMATKEQMDKLMKE
ncbi:MAG: hypothetical protein HYX24_01980 [Candidatus Aenigmarchaeota archaeon]|nr:hypothetical protein [Candidatus Aenigmarchaeota archaeon]